MATKHEALSRIPPPPNPRMRHEERGRTFSREWDYRPIRRRSTDDVHDERRMRYWYDEGKKNLRQEREESRRYAKSPDEESSDEPTERTFHPVNVNFYNSVCTNEGRQDNLPAAERHSARDTAMKRESNHIEQPPDDIINITFDRLMLRKGWYELEDYAQDEMKAYPTWKKWDIICRDRAEGAKRRSGHGNSRAVRFAEVPEFIESRGMFSGRGSPHPCRRTSVDDREMLRYVCTHCCFSYDDSKFSNFLARLKLCSTVVFAPLEDIHLKKQTGTMKKV